MSPLFVMKDAFRQIAGRMISALSGFVVVLVMTPLLGPLRYGDYTTILSYFALWSALSDLGLYVIGLKDIGKLKAKFGIQTPQDLEAITDAQRQEFSFEISQFVRARIGQIALVYTLAILVAYLIPSYAGNPYIAWGLPLGLLFSAGFMIAGIIQLPLQLFWRMEQVSIALILARLAQLLLLGIVVLVQGGGTTDPHTIPMSLFLLMVGSVALSSITQTLYTLRRSNKIIRLRYVPFIKPMIRHIKNNGKYGMAFFLSSFHTLLVSLIISIMYPTIEGFVYAGIRGLGLQLIQILLIIPSSIANSLIHGISSLKKYGQQESFGRLLNILIFFGWVCIANFFIFSTPIIRLISGTKYLTTTQGFSREGIREVFTSDIWKHLGTDFVVPWLGIVLALSFVKTVYNYIFVAANRHNILFSVNLLGISIGTLFAIIMVYYFNILGGIAAQFLMEALFVGGSIYYARRFDISPKLFTRQHRLMHIFFSLIILIVRGLLPLNTFSTLQFIVSIVVFNGIIISLWRKYIRNQFQHITLILESTEIESTVSEQITA